jgi:uncharacterized ion transporter superfamily protein YfcC
MISALVILLACGIGVLGSTVNPFATGIAFGFADVPSATAWCCDSSSSLSA